MKRITGCLNPAIPDDGSEAIRRIANPPGACPSCFAERGEAERFPIGSTSRLCDRHRHELEARSALLPRRPADASTLYAPSTLLPLLLNAALPPRRDRPAWAFAAAEVGS